MQIAIAILEKTPEGFISQIKTISPYFQYFQIDISDGVYTPNKTVQIEDLPQSVEQPNNRTIEQLSFDFHLMVKDYEKEIKKLENWETKKHGEINNVLIHYSLHPDLSLITAHSPFSTGLVLNIEDQVSDLTTNYDLQKIPVIQIMSVKLGYQGSQFFPQSLKKIEQLRLAGYRSKIVLDGGINDKTLPTILQQKYQPDILAVGSYLTHAGDRLQDHINYLQSAIK